MAVVENVFIGGVQTGFHAVLHHLARPGGTLQLLDLNTNVTKNICLNPIHLKYTHTHTSAVSAGGYLSGNLTINSLSGTNCIKIH